MPVLLDDTFLRDVLEAVKALRGRTTLPVIAHSERAPAACDRIVHLDKATPRFACAR
jgi:ABC-type multidrug transport system fused ATPase/permease subunit